MLVVAEELLALASALVGLGTIFLVREDLMELVLVLVLVVLRGNYNHK